VDIFLPVAGKFGSIGSIVAEMVDSASERNKKK